MAQTSVCDLAPKTKQIKEALIEFRLAVIPRSGYETKPRVAAFSRLSWYTVLGDRNPNGVAPVIQSKVVARIPFISVFDRRLILRETLRGRKNPLISSC